MALKNPVSLYRIKVVTIIIIIIIIIITGDQEILG